MSLTVVSHGACLAHDPGADIPECRERLAAVLEVLEREPFERLARLEAPQASLEQLRRVHSRAYIERLLELAPAEDLVSLDWDTRMGPASLEAALRAAGAVCTAADKAIEAEGERAFCAVRPPGHHAEPGKAMGFCLFNNVAVGAWHALARYGLERVAIVDFDVHHGNGSETMCSNEPRLLYCSTHQSPLYPGTGEREQEERNILNRPLPPGAASDEFRAAWRDDLLPALDAFRPELLFISAGFDAHKDDPLAQMQLETEDYAWLTGELLGLANRHCNGRLVSTLEGGYDLEALKQCVAVHLQALMK